MIPAWVIVPVAFAALTGKYYGFEIVEVARHRARMKKRKITEKEWMLVYSYLRIPKKIEQFKTLPEKRSLGVRISGNPNGYVVFVVLGLVFLFVSLDLTNPNISFLTPYFYSLLFSFLSGVFFFISVRMFLGPKRTWKLTVRTHDSDRYLLEWSELRKNEC